MKKIYVAHPYGGLEENEVNVEKVMKYISKKINTEIKEDSMLISPIHLFGHLYKEIPYKIGIDMCLNVLGGCDEIWIPDDFGYFQNSKGCLIEYGYAQGKGIKIVEYPVEDII